jgi:TP53 regulating kinase-like protein
MIYKEGQIYLIDFGLSYIKTSIEDRAVDLHVLERAFISTHPQLETEFGKVLIAYNDEAVLKRLEVVRQRGRKKVAFG